MHHFTKRFSLISKIMHSNSAHDDTSCNFLHVARSLLLMIHMSRSNLYYLLFSPRESCISWSFILWAHFLIKNVIMAYAGCYLLFNPTSCSYLILKASKEVMKKCYCNFYKMEKYWKDSKIDSDEYSVINLLSKQA